MTSDFECNLPSIPAGTDHAQSVQLPTIRFADDQKQTIRDLANEVPVSMVFNGSSHAVMMATPANLKDFALGFAFSEGFIRSISDIDRFELVHHEAGIEAHFWLKSSQSKILEARRRQMMGPIGCGLCGLESLEQALRDIPKVKFGQTSISAAMINRAVTDLQNFQPLHDRTRSVHAAGFYSPSQGVVMVREDVGRHNALDKLIGGLIDDDVDASQGAIVITSRLSMDLVQKTSMIGAPVLIAVSAPTATAIGVADEAGITLIGLARRGQFEVYTHSQRIKD